MSDVTVLIGGVDRTAVLITDTLRWTEYEGGQTGALGLEIEDTGSSLWVREWQEVVVQLDESAAWGGYIVRALPSITTGNTRRWALQCESYDTLLNRGPIVRKTYSNQTPGAILTDLFAESDLTVFNTSTLVATLPAIETFVARGEKLTDLLDRLALLSGAAWSINHSKQVVFQLPTALPTAPFSIAPLGTADLVNSFVPSGQPAVDIDAADIRNRVTVYGGQVPSSIQAETFTGDGATTRFTLAHAPVHEIVLVTVDGVLQWHGYDYYDSQFNDYDCLVDYTLGTVRWLDPPAVGAEIEVQYRYKQQLLTVRSSMLSYAEYGRWFDFELRDASLTTEAACIAAGDAILAEYAFGVWGAQLDVEWFGPRAGQRIQVTLPQLSLSGYYPIRQATIELARKTRRVLATLRVGGRSTRLSRVIGGERGTGSMTGPGTGTQEPAGTLSGEIDLLRVRDRIELIDRTTHFVSASDYGDANGLVLLFDPVQQQGRLLGLKSGALQAYFDNDGTIKWDGGNSLLNSSGAYIGSSTFGAAGIQMEHNTGNPRVYIGNGSTSYFQYAAGAATLAGTLYATAGHFSGSVYVGTADPRIHIDGANKRIESTNFASGTSGFRIEGTTGNAEFNNITARGAIASAVFTYNQIQASAGEIIVAKGAGKLKANAAVAASFAIDVEDPPGISHAAAGTLWVALDILRLNDPAIGDTWARVILIADMTTYWTIAAAYRDGDIGVTYPAGATLINYGRSGAGFVRISADGANAPYVSIATHAGSPWTTITERARLGNLEGISGLTSPGYGLWTDNGYFTGKVSASSGDIGGWTINSTYLAKDTGTASTSAGMAPSDYPFYAGSTYANRATAPFRVTPAGAMTATAGNIAGWTIASTKLYWEDADNFRGIGMATYDDASGYAFWAGDHRPDYAEFRVSKNGAIWANSGNVAGWTLASGHLYSGTGSNRAGMQPASYPFYAGSETQAAAPFRVTPAGALTATNVTITAGGGDVTLDANGLRMNYAAASTAYLSWYSSSTLKAYLGSFLDGSTNVLRANVQSSGRFEVTGAGEVNLSGTTQVGNFRNSGGLAFFATSGTGASQQTVTGSRGGNAALASLLTALATYGLIIDSSS